MAIVESAVTYLFRRGCFCFCIGGFFGGVVTNYLFIQLVSVGAKGFSGLHYGIGVKKVVFMSPSRFFRALVLVWAMLC